MNTKTVLILSLTLVFNRASVDAFVNGQNALNVIGQANFTANGHATTANGLYNPKRPLFVQDTIAGVAHERLYVPDSVNNRVLVYEGPFADNMSASYVIGQPDFITNTLNPAGTDSDLWAPASVAYDYAHHFLFVTDYLHNRIVVYDMNSLHNGMSAIHVIGQPNMTSTAQAGGVCTSFSAVPNATGVSWPQGIDYDNQHSRLFLADYCNNRVLVYDLSAGFTDGIAMPASYVIGQAVFTQGSAGLGPVNMMGPLDVSYDSTRQRLVVSDNNARRALIFDASHLANGMVAQTELGQPNFYTNLTATTQNGTSGAAGACFDPVNQRIFFSDTSATSSRVLVFNVQGGVTNGMFATTALGQSDFTSTGNLTTRNSLNYPSGSSYDPAGHRLFVADMNNNRIVIYSDTNLAGTGNVNCAGAAYTICGAVKSAEDSSITLQGVPMELRDSGGTLVKTIKTDSSGNYSFGSLTGGSTYFVTPVVGRTQSAAPFYMSAANLQSVGATTDFTIKGWPGTLNISGPAGTPILISMASYPGSDTPTMDPKSSVSNGYYSGAIGWDGKASLPVPGGSYYLTCWEAQASASETTTFVRSPATGSLGPTSVSANHSTALACP